MSFPRYPKYKPSDVRWLGSVPEHWDVKPIRSVARLESGHTPSRDHPEYWVDCTVPWFTLSDVWQIREGGRQVIQETRERVSELGLANSAARKLPAGTVMLSRTASVGYSAIMGVEMATTQDFANWVCGADLIPEFLLYVFRSMSSEFGRLMMGSTHNTIYMPDIQAMKCAIPPFAEQRTIVGFLDRETTKIDALVAEQERLIELLAESRQAVISHAVTTGIDRSAPMKQSGSAFLGDIPSHWQVAKLKHVVPQLTVGIVVEPSKYYEEAGVPALRSLNVRPGRIVLDDLVRISPKSNELHSKSRLFAGDLVSVRSGQPGTTAVIPEHLDGCNCVDLLIIRRPEDSTEEYLCWFLGSIPARAQVIHGTDGAIQQHFNVGTAGNLLVANPPSSEKHRISGWLSQACSRIDELVCECRRATGLLRERRSALISAAVTGQIDVRTAVPAEVA